MHRREPSATSPLCTRVVAASEPDVLVTHLAIERASGYDLIGRPVVHDSLGWLQAPHHSHVYPAFPCMVLGLNPELLVSQGSAPTAYSCISTLRCRATAVS